MRLGAIGALLLAACGGADPTPPMTAGPRGAYPAGPYGIDKGAIIENLALVNSDGQSISLESIYKDGANKILLITTSAGWCTACIEEQPLLIERHNTYGARGLYIMIASFEDDQSRPATPAYASQWKRRYSLPFTVVADQQFVFGRFYDKATTPMVMLVDVAEMKILAKTIGFDKSVIDAILGARL